MQPVIKLHYAHFCNKPEVSSGLELLMPVQTSCAQTGIIIYKARQAQQQWPRPSWFLSRDARRRLAPESPRDSGLVELGEAGFALVGRWLFFACANLSFQLPRNDDMAETYRGEVASLL